MDKKQLMVHWLRAPSKVARFIKYNKIKQKDIISIGRSPRGEVEIWYFTKHPEKICDTEMKDMVK